jgi:hypothetical protein
MIRAVIVPPNLVIGDQHTADENQSIILLHVLASAIVSRVIPAPITGEISMESIGAIKPPHTSILPLVELMFPTQLV